MTVLDPGQQTLTTPALKIAIRFADIEENLELSINPGPYEWNILTCLVVKLHKN